MKKQYLTALDLKNIDAMLEQRLCIINQPEKNKKIVEALRTKIQNILLQVKIEVKVDEK